MPLKDTLQDAILAVGKMLTVVEQKEYLQILQFHKGKEDLVSKMEVFKGRLSQRSSLPTFTARMLENNLAIIYATLPPVGDKEFSEFIEKRDPLRNKKNRLLSASWSTLPPLATPVQERNYSKEWLEFEQKANFSEIVQALVDQLYQQQQAQNKSVSWFNRTLYSCLTLPEQEKLKTYLGKDKVDWMEFELSLSDEQAAQIDAIMYKKEKNNEEIKSLTVLRQICAVLNTPKQQKDLEVIFPDAFWAKFALDCSLELPQLENLLSSNTDRLAIAQTIFHQLNAFQQEKLKQLFPHDNLDVHSKSRLRERSKEGRKRSRVIPDSESSESSSEDEKMKRPSKKPSVKKPPIIEKIKLSETEKLIIQQARDFRKDKGFKENQTARFQQTEIINNIPYLKNILLFEPPDHLSYENSITWGKNIRAAINKLRACYIRSASISDSNAVVLKEKEDTKTDQDSAEFALNNVYRKNGGKGEPLAQFITEKMRYGTVAVYGTTVFSIAKHFSSLDVIEDPESDTDIDAQQNQSEHQAEPSFFSEMDKQETPHSQKESLPGAVQSSVDNNHTIIEATNSHNDPVSSMPTRVTVENDPSPQVSVTVENHPSPQVMEKHGNNPFNFLQNSSSSATILKRLANGNSLEKNLETPAQDKDITIPLTIEACEQLITQYKNKEQEAIRKKEEAALIAQQKQAEACASAQRKTELENLFRQKTQAFFAKKIPKINRAVQETEDLAKIAEQASLNKENEDKICRALEEKLRAFDTEDEETIENPTSEVRMSF